MMRGDDIDVGLNLDFVAACKGVKRTVNVAVVVEHDVCKGSGLKPGRKRETCRTCNGSGVATFAVQGGFQMQTTCTTCRGSGQTTPRDAVCDDCGGVGKVKEKKTVSIDVPAGVEDGMRIRVPGAGDAPIEGKGPPGDLFVRVNVAPSKLFRRQGANLFYDQTIPFYTAALGGQARVPTLESDVAVRVPSGTQPNEEMVLKGRGIKKVNASGHGDLTVRFKVAIPRSLSPTQRMALQAVADEAEGRTPPKDEAVAKPAGA